VRFMNDVISCSLSLFGDHAPSCPAVQLWGLTRISDQGSHANGARSARSSLQQRVILTLVQPKPNIAEAALAVQS
jgi:hypothetical protein